jgi:hypothetical protein
LQKKERIVGRVVGQDQWQPTISEAEAFGYAADSPVFIVRSRIEVSVLCRRLPGKARPSADDPNTRWQRMHDLERFCRQAKILGNSFCK